MACSRCAIKARCTTGDYRRVSRWVHAEVLDRAQVRLDERPEVMRTRRATVEHPFGTIKSWMGAPHFLTRTLPRVRTDMSLHVLAYNRKRAINLLGTQNIVDAIRASDRSRRKKRRAARRSAGNQRIRKTTSTSALSKASYHTASAESDPLIRVELPGA